MSPEATDNFNLGVSDASGTALAKFWHEYKTDIEKGVGALLGATVAAVVLKKTGTFSAIGDGLKFYSENLHLGSTAQLGFETRAMNESILQESSELATWLAKKHPQGADGRLGHYYAGCFGLNLLSLAGGKFEPLESRFLPAIVTSKPLQIPPEGMAWLSRSTRSLNDLDVSMVKGDFIWTGIFHNQRQIAISYSELPRSARKLFTTGDHAIFDVFENPTADDVVRMQVAGHDFYVKSPMSMLAYKALNIGEILSPVHNLQEAKARTIFNEFHALNYALRTLYSDEAIAQAAHDVVFDYQHDNPNVIPIHYHHAEFTSEMASFFDRIIACDPDGRYLDNLRCGRERSIGILKILHRLPASEAKQSVINFINKHPETIEQWSPMLSTWNRRLAAEWIVENQLELAHLTKDTAVEKVMKQLDEEVWFFQRSLKEMPAQTLDIQPEESEMLRTLMTVDATRASQELAEISYLLEHGVDEVHVHLLMRSQYAVDPKAKSDLLGKMVYAANYLHPEQIYQFMHDLTLAIRQKSMNMIQQPRRSNWNIVLPQQWRRR